MKRSKQLIKGLGLVACLLFGGWGGLSAQTLEWAFAMGGSDGQSRLPSAVNADGQLYTAGTFSGTIDFDLNGGTANLSTSAKASVFVTQVDAEGQLAWAKAFSGPGESRAQVIALDANGFLYLMGYFTGVVDFNPGVGTINLNAGDIWQQFVAKLDAQGNGVWAKQFASNPGPRSSGMGWSLAVSESGEVYLHGHFSGTLDFDTEAGNFPLSTDAYEVDAFLLKLSSTGNFLWVRQLSGSLRNRQPNLVVDGSGNAFLAGYFQDTLQLSAGAAPVVASGCSDAFVAKWDAAGQLTWVLPMGGARWDAAKHLTVDEEGWAYVTGYFSGTASFGNAQLSSIGETDAFAVRIDPSGQVAWAKQMGGSQADEGAAIALDAQGYMYLAGRFRGSADFGATAGTLNALGHSDVFLAKFNQEDGEAVWALRAGGLGEEDLQALLIDANNSLYLLGGFEGQLLFDPMLQGSPLAASTAQDRFTAKIRQCFSSQATVAAYVCESYTLNGQTYSSSGTYEQLLTNANGCDSLLTLVLDINEPTTATISASTCGSYTLNGQTYSSSGTYEQVLTNANGCDSLLTLALTISQLSLQLAIAEQPSCQDSSDGQIVASVGGGVPPYHFLWSDGQSAAVASNLVAGQYELTLTDEAGCEQTASMGITAAFIPELTVQSQDNRLFVEEQGYDYQWVDCSTGDEIPGATVSSYLAERSGRYAVVARSEGCEQQSNCWPVIVEPEQLLAHFFPNPNVGSFTLFVPDAATLTVYDAKGQHLHSQVMKTGLHEMELAHLPSGNYFILLEYESGQQTLTWIKY